MTFVERLKSELARELPLEQTLQVAMLRASGMQKNDIIRELGIDVKEFEMCAYRIRAITRDWLR